MSDAAVWEPQEGEPLRHYRLFLQYLNDYPNRRIYRVAERNGMSYGWLRQIAGTNKWTSRAAAYDEYVEALKPPPEVMDEAATRAAHLAAGKLLLDMGLKGLRVKQPEALTVAELRRLIEAGAELQHRANGGADLTLNHRVTGDDLKAIEELLGEPLTRDSDEAGGDA